MADSSITLSAKKTKKAYKAKISLNPMPSNCYECPFYHMPNPNDDDTWYEYWDCYLKHIDDMTGIALNRPKCCPIESE